MKPFREAIAEAATFHATSVLMDNKIDLTYSFSSERVLAEVLESVNLLQPEQLASELQSSTAPSTIDQSEPALALDQNTVSAPRLKYPDQSAQYNRQGWLNMGQHYKSKKHTAAAALKLHLICNEC